MLENDVLENDVLENDVLENDVVENDVLESGCERGVAIMAVFVHNIPILKEGSMTAMVSDTWSSKLVSTGLDGALMYARMLLRPLAGGAAAAFRLLERAISLSSQADARSNCKGHKEQCHNRTINQLFE